MKQKSFIILALICAMTTAVFTACSDNDDNPNAPSGDVNKGIVINLDSIVIKPYLLFGTSLTNVVRYTKGIYHGWSYSTEGWTNILDETLPYWLAIYRHENKSVQFIFDATDDNRYIMATYGYYNEIPYSAIKAELERNNFTYEGRLFFDGDDADVCYMYISADRSIEVQYARWDADGCWCLSFQPLDKNDLSYLKKESDI